VVLLRLMSITFVDLTMIVTSTCDRCVRIITIGDQRRKVVVQQR
jgi:hypothetical protein